ncbi:TATA-box binding [Halobacillus dabanensis]|uniref:TATA-box binding n=1 Tax=Halobacillus dabanensis TaxID=240302 RepID=A0A1I3X7R3_HALDA|nr:YwmB family TATA-box binding protein [Halobacillus dabanensis]SFK15628.1 TATA-box binding [Halobacillus dabanensis]
MKSVFAGIIALLIIGTGAYPQEMTGAQATLMQFASFAADKQLEVNGWTITMKEKITRNEADRMKQKLQKYFNDPVIINETTMNAEKYTISDSQKNKDIAETYSMIFPENKLSDVEMVYTVEGQGKPSLNKLNQKELNEETRRFFSKNVTIFTCIKTTYNGIIDDVLVYEKFEKAFDVVTIDVIDENGWTSRTGYTKEWDQSIPTKDRLMNSQFATRTLGGKTNITIGTPIITAEY